MSPPRSQSNMVCTFVYSNVDCSWLIPCFSSVTFAGSALFILFGIIYLYEAFLSIDIDVSDISYHS